MVFIIEMEIISIFLVYHKKSKKSIIFLNIYKNYVWHGTHTRSIYRKIYAFKQLNFAKTIHYTLPVAAGGVYVFIGEEYACE